MERNILDDMGMTGESRGDDYGDSPASDTINVVPTAHELAAGLSGPVRIGNSMLGWGVPAPAAVRIATGPESTDRFVIFAYAKGDDMVGMKAPAVRIAFLPWQFYPEYNAARVLLSAAIEWALD
jgi:hypothetical protein